MLSWIYIKKVHCQGGGHVKHELLAQSVHIASAFLAYKQPAWVFFFVFSQKRKRFVRPSVFAFWLNHIIKNDKTRSVIINILIGSSWSWNEKMRLLFVVGVCLTLVFVVKCLEGKAEFIEDEEEMDQRHFIKRVSSFTKGLWLYGFKKICKKGVTSKAFYVNVLWSKFFPRFLYKTLKFLVSCIKTTKGARKNWLANLNLGIETLLLGYEKTSSFTFQGINRLPCHSF